MKGASIDFLTRSQKTRKLKEEEVKINLVQVSYTKACSATRPREVLAQPFLGNFVIAPALRRSGRSARPG